MGSFLKNLVTELETKLKDAEQDIDGQVRGALDALKTEVTQVEADAKNAEVELKAEVSSLVAQYAPEAKALESELVAAVEDALSSLLSHFGSGPAA